jgi:hypothetical protein
MHDTVTNNTRITATTAGKYLISADVEWAGKTTGYRITAIYLNGATLIGQVSSPPLLTAVSMAQSVSIIYALVATDYVEVRVTQTSGGNLNVQRTADYTPLFMAVWVAP